MPFEFERLEIPDVVLIKPKVLGMKEDFLWKLSKKRILKSWYRF